MTTAIIAFLTFLTGLALGLGTGWWLRARRDWTEEEETGADPEIEPRFQRTAPPAVTAAIATALANRLPKQAAMAEGVKPYLYATPSEGPADDLKKISGIGPKYEQRLYDLGVYYYRQIAGWSEEEIIWLDRALGFPGRIARELWQEQAVALLKGMKTDFAVRYDKGETPSSYSR